MSIPLTAKRTQEAQSQNKDSHTHDFHQQCRAQKSSQTPIQQVGHLLGVKRATQLNSCPLLYVDELTQTEELGLNSDRMNAVFTGLDL